MPNTKDQYQQLIKKMKLGAPVSMRDLAIRADNEEESLFDLMVRNDPEQVSALLHHSGAPFVVGENAKFIPQADRLRAELKQLLIRQDHKDINDIIGAFKWNMRTRNFTTDPELLQHMELINLLGYDKAGNRVIKTRVIS